jgi:hypothetical protein
MNCFDSRIPSQKTPTAGFETRSIVVMTYGETTETSFRSSLEQFEVSIPSRLPLYLFSSPQPLVEKPSGMEASMKDLARSPFGVPLTLCFSSV